MNDENDDKKGFLTEKEADLWRVMTKDVKKFEDQKYLKGQDFGEKQKNISQNLVKQPEFTALLSKNSENKKIQGFEIDKRTEIRLKRGQIPIESRIDLHGMAQNQARSILFPFIQDSYHRGYRCVLVITGKGQDNKGVLKQSVPEWLAEGVVRNIVLKTVFARIKDGGEGALYVYLRRKRE